MVIHNRKHHGGSDVFSYKMEPTGVFRTPLDRQLDESMRLKYSGANIIMNSGAEWRGESIPRASFGPTLPNLREERRKKTGGEDREGGRREVRTLQRSS